MLSILKLYWLYRSSVLSGWRCAWSIPILELVSVFAAISVFEALQSTISALVPINMFFFFYHQEDSSSGDYEKVNAKVNGNLANNCWKISQSIWFQPSEWHCTIVRGCHLFFSWDYHLNSFASALKVVSLLRTSCPLIIITKLYNFLW